MTFSPTAVSPGSFYVGLAFNIIGLVGALSLLLTICLAPSVKRHPIFVNFILCTVIFAAWIFFKDVAIILLPEEQLTDASEGPTWRAIGTTVSVVFITAFLSLIIHLLFLVKQTIHGKSGSKIEVSRTVALILLPYMVGLSGISCLRSSTATDILGYFSFALSFLTVFLDAYLTFIFLRIRKDIKEGRLVIDFSLSFAIRLFSLCIVRLVFTLAFTIGNVLGGEPSSSVGAFELFMGNLLSLAVVVFFVQKDIIHVWVSIFMTLRHELRSHSEPVTSQSR